MTLEFIGACDQTGVCKNGWYQTCSECQALRRKADNRMPRTTSRSSKDLYDKLLQRVHDTARSVEERMQRVARQFPDTSTSQNEATDCRRMRVLIIEDNEDQAESLAAVLRLWGFETEVAYDGDAGIDCAIRDCPDAILADIGLPGLSGYEVARQLTALPAFRNTIMAAVTAYSDPASVERGKEVGFEKHFAKPVDLAALHRFLDDRRDILLRDG